MMKTDSYVFDLHAASTDCVALEDSIMVKGSPVQAGSGILEGFISPVDATVVERLRENGFPLGGKTRMLEFGIPNLQEDEEAAASGALGAVEAVASGAARWALCNDIFGVYRRLAVARSVCYIHPTYGTVSRYGLIPLACSMDQIGVVCRDPADGFKLLSFIAGKDPRDGAMLPEAAYKYENTCKEITIGLPETVVALTGDEHRAALRAFAGRFPTVEAALPLFPYCKQVMYILASAEISGNLSRYDGIKFGRAAPDCRDLKELYTRSRTEGFGRETKLASVMGAMLLSQAYYSRYYEKAMQVRRLIKESLRFDKYDVLALPCFIQGDPFNNLSLYALAPLAGLPSATFSFMGQGIQLLAKPGNEAVLRMALEVLGR